MTSTEPVTHGAHHIGLTIPNLHDTQAFFVDALGFKVAGEKPDYPAAFVSDGIIMITLWQAVNPAQATAFDRKNVIGLHHIALKIDGLEQLEKLHSRLKDTPGVNIEFSPEPLGKGPTQHFIVSIPGGIRVEFIAPVQQLNK